MSDETRSGKSNSGERCTLVLTRSFKALPAGLVLATVEPVAGIAVRDVIYAFGAGRVQMVSPPPVPGGDPAPRGHAPGD